MEYYQKKNLTKQTNKNFEIAYDYYTQLLISKYAKKEKSFHMLQNYLNINTLSIFPSFDVNRISSVYPLALLYLNSFNFISVIKKKVFFSNENFRNILADLFKINITVINDNFLAVYSLGYRTVKNALVINFSPQMLLNKSIIYSISYLNFLYRFNSQNGELSQKDYRELFFISGLGTIPFSNYLENLYLKNYISEGKGLLSFFRPHQKFSLVCLKSIMDNYVILASYFYLISYFTCREKCRETLYERKNYPLLKEAINSGREEVNTFRRLETFYFKDEEIGEKFDITLPIIYSSFILSFLYTPLDYAFRFMINNKSNLRELVNLLTGDQKENSLANSINNRPNSFIRIKHLMAINFLQYFLKYGLIIFSIQEFKIKFT